MKPVTDAHVDSGASTGASTDAHMDETCHCHCHDVERMSSVHYIQFCIIKLKITYAMHPSCISKAQVHAHSRQGRWLESPIVTPPPPIPVWNTTVALESVSVTKCSEFWNVTDTSLFQELVLIQL